MYDKRSRVGLIVPSANTVSEPEFNHALPDDVSIHTARMPLTEGTEAALQSMIDQADRCAELLADADVDVIAYACTTGSLIRGPGFQHEIEDRLEEIADVPVVATAAAVLRALDRLDADSISLSTPYTSELVRDEIQFLKDHHYEIDDFRTLEIRDSLKMGRTTSETAYEQAKELDSTGSDTIFISCTNYRTFGIIKRLERELEIPVVTSNQATLWNVLQTLEMSLPDDELGQLFDREWK